MDIGITHYIFVGALLFYISLLGLILHRKSLIHILVCLELLLLSININFVAFSQLFLDIKGQIFTIFILTIAAAEMSIGLAIIIVFFRIKGNISIENISISKDERLKDSKGNHSAS